MVLYGLTLVAIVIAVVAFAMIIHSRRQMPRKKGKVLVAKDKKDRKMSGSNFKKLTVDERPKGNNKSKKMSIGPKQDRRNTGHI